MRKSETTRSIETVINGFDPAMREQCLELAEHFRRQVAAAGTPVGEAAFALVGSELQTAAEDE